MSAASIDVLLTITAFGGGGTERYVEDLAVGLAERGIRVAVSVDFGSLERARGLRSADVPVHILGAESADAIAYSGAFRQLIGDLRPRLIHVNGWAHHREIIQAAASHHIPTLYTNHCTPRRPLLREWFGINTVPFALYRQRALAKHSGAAISISRLGLRNLAARVGRNVPSLVVYNGVPHVEIAGLSSSAEPRIVWLGSLIQRKRPLLAIEVFRHILQRRPEARLEIYGDGPLLGEVRRAAGQLPADTVRIKGFCPSIIDSLKGAYAYLQTSGDEGLAYSILDAMSVGLPVVATNAGATSEAVLHRKTGLICDVDDTASLNGALQQLLDSSEMAATFGEAGLRRAREVFALDRMVTETLAAYSTLCAVEISPQNGLLNGSHR